METQPLQHDPVRILIVEDHVLVREGLKLMLSLDKSVEVIGDTSNGNNALPLIQSLRPDLVLLDLDLPGCHGTEIAMRIKAENPEIRIIILTASLDASNLRRALGAGADGYVVKHDGIVELNKAIPVVLSGGSFVSSSLAEISSGAWPASVNLTLRERQILALIARGKTSQDIAEELILSVHTIRTHRKNIMDKLGLHNAAEITAWAIRNLHD